VRPAAAGPLTLSDVVGTWWVLGGDLVWRACSIDDLGGGALRFLNEWGQATTGTWDAETRTLTADEGWYAPSIDVSPNVYRLLWEDGRVWARAPNPVSDDLTIEYYHPDALGSVRALTNLTGQVVARHDYSAFGEGPGTSAGSEKQRFTGKDRDAETFLDYFGARYYRNVTGRFGTVDPVMNVRAALLEPQRWNRYVYVGNNPLGRLDPDGQDWGDLFRGIGIGAVNTVVGTAVMAGRAFIQDPTLSTEVGGALAGEGEIEALARAVAHPRATAWQAAQLFTTDPGHQRLGELMGSFAVSAALGAAVGGAAAAAGSAQRLAVRFDPSRGGHIFREAAGHVNPASAGSQARFARLFENVASNPANLRADAVQAGLITQQAAEAGVQAFTWTGRTGQVWVTIRNGVIQNAGVNPLGALR
jgi:RHS repeat-associated protein